MQVTFGLYNYKRCSKWWPLASRHLLVCMYMCVYIFLADPVFNMIVNQDFQNKYN